MAELFDVEACRLAGSVVMCWFLLTLVKTDAVGGLTSGISRAASWRRLQPVVRRHP